MTNSSLTKIADHLEHGEFTNPFQPPTIILPDQKAEWRAESAGIFTGTEGSVDYQVDGSGDKVHFEWDNPAVGNTFFGFPPPTQTNGTPSDFVFFTIHLATDGSVEPDPVLGPRVLAVTQGDTDGAGIILPLPGQKGIKPHAWFDIGIRNKRDPVSVSRWLKALGIDPTQGIRTILLKKFSVKELIELPL
ncbi:hypothetical protein [Phormidesmis priestleyi]